MSVDAFLAEFAVGGGLVAIWLAVRFERFAPRSFYGVLAHLGIAGLLPALVLPLLDRAIVLSGAVSGTMLVAFPLVVYMFLSGAWLIMWAQRMLGVHSPRL